MSGYKSEGVCAGHTLVNYNKINWLDTTIGEYQRFDSDFLFEYSAASSFKSMGESSSGRL